MKNIRSLAAAAATLALLAAPARAVPVIQFAQTSSANTITATDNGTATTIAGTDIAVNVAQDLGGLLGLAFLDLSATSIDAAVAVGTGVVQHFAGTFSVTSLPSGGVNLLSGVFSDAAIGAGPALGLVIGSPPDTLSLTSDLITAADLAAPLALSFGFTNVSPGVHIDGTTLAAFSATVAGNASASVQEVPEPASLALLGVGLVALGLARHRRPAGGDAAA